MPDPVIRLDRSKPFSECRGDRTPDDPHYQVHNWQGQRIGKDMILLPFDAKDELVPDDGKTEPYQGVNPNSAPGQPATITHYPLYNQAMRDLVARKMARLAGPAAAAADAPAASVDRDEEEEQREAEDEVNFVSYLRGEAKYPPDLLRAAFKKRYSKVHQKIGDLVVDLVLDEKVVPEDQVCESLKKFLPAKAA